MSIIAVLCLTALVMAWQASQPLTKLSVQAQQALRIAEQTSRIEVLTVELQYWQLRLSHAAQSNSASKLTEWDRLHASHSRTARQLSAAVDQLTAENLSPKQQSIMPGLSVALDIFERVDNYTIQNARNDAKQNIPTLSPLYFSQIQQTAQALVDQAKLLNEATLEEANELQIKANEQNKFLWQGIAISMGGALLFAAVLTWLLRQTLRTNANLAREINLAARTDPLTGLLNRRALEQRLDAEFNLASRKNTPLCLVLIDLDFFKQYNDTHGHVKGDELLKDCASYWRAETRASDLLARIGGEEFALVMNNCNPEQARSKTTTLRQSMPWGTNFSAGVALWQQGEPFVDWYRRADAALYLAKENGRARTEVA